MLFLLIKNNDNAYHITLFQFHVSKDELKAKAEEEELLNKKKALETSRHQLDQDVCI